MVAGHLIGSLTLGSHIGAQASGKKVVGINQAREEGETLDAVGRSRIGQQRGHLRQSGAVCHVGVYQAHGGVNVLRHAVGQPLGKVQIGVGTRSSDEKIRLVFLFKE